jgi:hypothetical protein
VPWQSRPGASIPIIPDGTWFPSFFDAYRKSDYPGALEVALKVNMPGFWRTNVAFAAVYGQLGEVEAAHKAARELLALKPDFAVIAREELEKWWRPELVEQLIDGLRKAGLEIVGGRGTVPAKLAAKTDPKRL